MPYLKSDDKNKLESKASKTYRTLDIGCHCTTAGELNYTITRILQGYLFSNGTCYQKINDCLGALEGAKLEFYRRTVAPYEDKKIQSNGDVC